MIKQKLIELLRYAIKEDNHLSNSKEILSEFRNQFNLISSASDVLEQKIIHIVFASSLLISLVTTINAAFQKPVTCNNKDLIYYFIIGLFVVIIILSIIGLCPRQNKLPIKADWYEIQTNLIPLKEDDFIDKLLVGYINTISATERNNRKKAKIFVISFILMAIIFLLSIIYIFI